MAIKSKQILFDAQNLFGSQVVSYSPTEPTNKISNMLWFEPGAIFPQPWTWDSINGLWMSSPYILDFAYTNFSITTSDTASANTSWTNRTVPFYGINQNRIRINHIFGTLYNTGTVDHGSTLFYKFFLDRFLGSAQMVQTIEITPDTQGMTAVTYNDDSGFAPDRPNSSSMKRITMTNLTDPNNSSLPLWLPGNTWYQRLRAQRFGTSTTSSGVTIAITLIAVVSFARSNF